MPPSTDLAITNPLVLYRAWISTKRINPDPGQHRLALHLQKLYERLIDYEPRIEYGKRLETVARALNSSNVPWQRANAFPMGRRGVWASLLEQKEKRDSLALTEVLTSHEEAMRLDSPKGLLLHGEVGTGKSMLIDLFAECLPTKKKRRWHYNTFMLEVLGKLEQQRRGGSGRAEEYSLMWLARNLVESSPILFLDEFQLPDRTAAKLISNLMTAFFQLGGVLIATSNRMPDELAKAAGTEFTKPPPRLESLRWNFGRRQDIPSGGRIYAAHGEYADFLALLNARCDIWEMEGGRDYRRSEPGTAKIKIDITLSRTLENVTQKPRHKLQSTPDKDAITDIVTTTVPSYYYIELESSEDAKKQENWRQSFLRAEQRAAGSDKPPAWVSLSMKVYGREVTVPRAFNGAASFTFAELCGSKLGPADYITLSSTFHTVIVKEVPVITLLLKEEARRFITLLDALYEARCKLLISAAVGPDELFFPETRLQTPHAQSDVAESLQDSVYSETFSEIYQDVTEPFRPNVSSYSSTSASTERIRTRAGLDAVLPDDALEDQPPNRLWRRGDSTNFADRQHLERERFEVRRTPDFTQTGAFTGEDERSAYKRAASRLWEMCGEKWWTRNEEGWWRPLPKHVRRWEGDVEAESTQARLEEGLEPLGPGEGAGSSRDVTEEDDEVLFRHGASPFRTAADPPPKISWTHVWGTIKWGKRAGAWGQGVEGLNHRKSPSQRE